MPDVRLTEKTMHVPVADAGLFVKRFAHVPEQPRERHPTLVFLHDGLGSVGQWKSFPAELCRAVGCDGIAYDRRGHGKSSPMDAPRSPDYFDEEAERYLAGLLDALRIRRPLLIGHSDGASIALKFASFFPERPVAMISEAAHVIVEEATLEGIRTARRLHETTDLGAKLSRYHGDNTDTVFRAWTDTWRSLERASWDMLDDLHRVHCPVLIVQGAEDQYGSHRQVHLIAEHVAGYAETLWIEGCGHVPHMEQRDLVIKRMAEFIRGSIVQ